MTKKREEERGGEDKKERKERQNIYDRWWNDINKQMTYRIVSLVSSIKDIINEEKCHGERNLWREE